MQRLEGRLPLPRCMGQDELRPAQGPVRVSTCPAEAKKMEERPEQRLTQRCNKGRVRSEAEVIQGHWMDEEVRTDKNKYFFILYSLPLLWNSLPQEAVMSAAEGFKEELEKLMPRSIKSY